jgi:hypothetical protein
VSFVGTDDLILHAGADAEGMVVTQVVPPYYLTELKTVAMCRKTLAKYFPGEQPGFGLGPQLRLDYSGRDHAGLKAVIPTVIRGGRAVPFTDWAMVK